MFFVQVYFWTGSPALPASEDGFQPMPSVTIRPADDAHLPTANTCISRLYIPLYSSRAVLRQKLLLAIKTKNFGFVWFIRFVFGMDVLKGLSYSLWNKCWELHFDFVFPFDETWGRSERLVIKITVNKLYIFLGAKKQIKISAINLSCNHVALPR